MGLVSMSQKTALVTGASVGIGAATAKRLHHDGYSLILLARRKDALDHLNQLLGGSHKVITCDMTEQSQIDSALDQMDHIDVLINNAGLALGLSPGHESDWEHWSTMIQTNCVSLAYLTRQLLPSMVSNNSGHIVNLGSIAGTYAYRGGNVYGATKAFVEQFSMGLRSDLLGTKVRVTNLEPGLIEGTEFSNVRFEGNLDKVSSTYADCEALSADDIAEAISWVLAQPAHMNINRMEIMPTCQAPGGPAIHRAK